MKYVVGLTAGFLMSAGAAMADDYQGPHICDHSFELGPSGYLEEGSGVFIQPGDLSSNGRVPACTAGALLERHKDFLEEQGRDDAIKMCEVGEGGLEVGPGPHGSYYYDQDTNPDPDPRLFICRDNKGGCVICELVIN
ncbi:MAG: hypothetical protein AB8B83_09170 [Bdellovibrionales bacterium]